MVLCVMVYIPFNLRVNGVSNIIAIIKIQHHRHRPPSRGAAHRYIVFVLLAIQKIQTLVWPNELLTLRSIDVVELLIYTYILNISVLHIF